jgi:Domain of Unknown Function (DUF1080)
MNFMKKQLCVLLCASFSLASAEEKWVDLFDGKTLTGWKAQTEANWRVEEGAIVVDHGPIGLLTTDRSWKNYELELEFRAQIGSNSGVFLSTKPTVTDESKDCYEVNIAPPSNPFPTGSIVKRKQFQGAGERVEWRKYRMIVKDGRVQVWLDNKESAVYQDPSPLLQGLIGLQINQGKVEFRRIRVREMD